MVLERLRAMLQAQPPLTAPDAVVAVEVRDPGARPRICRTSPMCCAQLGASTLPGPARTHAACKSSWPSLLRLLWPAPGNAGTCTRPMAHGYEDAQSAMRPMTRIHDPEPQLLAELAQVIAGTTRAQPART
ncbi:MAG: hypothetical protein U1E57_07230 [Paenacidovorax caeni]